MKEILEEKILNIKIEFTLKEKHSNAKKVFHELIIDIIKKKRQTIVEAVMIKALDSYLKEEEDQKIRQVFFQLCASIFEEMLLKKKKMTIQDHGRGKNQGEARNGNEMEYDVDISEVNIANCTFYGRFEGERMNA